jgi:hypothetical protein
MTAFLVVFGLGMRRLGRSRTNAWVPLRAPRAARRAITLTLPAGLQIAAAPSPLRALLARATLMRAAVFLGLFSYSALISTAIALVRCQRIPDAVLGDAESSGGRLLLTRSSGCLPFPQPLSHCRTRAAGRRAWSVSLPGSGSWSCCLLRWPGWRWRRSRSRPYAAGPRSARSLRARRDRPSSARSRRSSSPARCARVAHRHRAPRTRDSRVQGLSDEPLLAVSDSAGDAEDGDAGGGGRGRGSVDELPGEAGRWARIGALLQGPFKQTFPARWWCVFASWPRTARRPASDAVRAVGTACFCCSCSPWTYPVWASRILCGAGWSVRGPRVTRPCRAVTLAARPKPWLPSSCSVCTWWWRPSRRAGSTACRHAAAGHARLAVPDPCGRARRQTLLCFALLLVTVLEVGRVAEAAGACAGRPGRRLAQALPARAQAAGRTRQAPVQLPPSGPCRWAASSTIASLTGRAARGVQAAATLLALGAALVLLALRRCTRRPGAAVR